MTQTNSSEARDKRFKRVAAKRTQRVLNDLRLLGNCSNKGIYKYGSDEVGKMFSAIEKEIRRIKSLFRSNSKDNHFNF